jgi:hypothetical protein
MSAPQKTAGNMCPFCGSADLVHGSLLTGGDYPNFYLTEMKNKFWRLFWPRLPFAKEAQACAKCGMVWAQMDPAQLRKNVQAYGTEELKQRLE